MSRLKAALLIGGLLPAMPGIGQPRVDSQVQVARQFWLAAVQQDWPQAYRWLTPAAQAELSQKQFRHSLLPLRGAVRQFGPVIDLYKLGYRLRETAASETFVAYSFRADTLARRPHFQLDISFQDSTTRRIQRFRLVRLME